MQSCPLRTRPISRMNCEAHRCIAATCLPKPPLTLPSSAFGRRICCTSRGSRSLAFTGPVRITSYGSTPANIYCGVSTPAAVNASSWLVHVPNTTGRDREYSMKKRVRWPMLMRRRLLPMLPASYVCSDCLRTSPRSTRCRAHGGGSFTSTARTSTNSDWCLRSFAICCSIARHCVRTAGRCADFCILRMSEPRLPAILTSKLQGAVNVGSDRRISLAELIERIARLIGRPGLVRLGARAAAAEPPLLIPVTRRLCEEAAWRPRFDLDEGLADTINWWKARLAAASAGTAPE